MAAFTPPKYVNKVLTTLQARGYSAYMVGGCVRDVVMGLRPNDYDLCSSALPEQVMELFPRCVPTGIRHGTVTILLGKKAVELTTFRTEVGYADHRHPDSVRFVTELEEDLSRRDFSINAMAMTADGEITDPFGGREDIEAGLIRCVGEPARRFEEDALRMFRALRFAARLGFKIEESTYAAIKEKAALSQGLAAERVREELEKLILSERPGMLAELIDLGLMARWFKAPCEAGPGDCADRASGPAAGTVWQAEAGLARELQRLKRLPKQPVLRWAALCMVLSRRGLIESPEAFLSSLRLDGHSLRLCAAVCAGDRAEALSSRLSCKRLIGEQGREAALALARCADTLYGGQRLRLVRQVIESGECCSVRELAISGQELLALGYSGRELGAMLRRLLDRVIAHPQDNTKERLTALAQTGEKTWIAGKS